MESGSFTVLLIDTGDRVVTSPVLKRALAKADVTLTADQRLLVCGYNFTQEVRATLAAAGAFCVSERDSYWTDESYHQIRQAKPHTEDRTKER